MTTAELATFYRSLDSDNRPCLPEPAELVAADWDNAGRME